MSKRNLRHNSVPIGGLEPVKKRRKICNQNKNNGHKRECTQRTHTFEDDMLKQCAENKKEQFLEMKCLNCGKVSFGCKFCAEHILEDLKPRRKKWYYNNQQEHLNNEYCPKNARKNGVRKRQTGGRPTKGKRNVVKISNDGRDGSLPLRIVRVEHASNLALSSFQRPTVLVNFVHGITNCDVQVLSEGKVKVTDDVARNIENHCNKKKMKDPDAPIAETWYNMCRAFKNGTFQRKFEKALKDSRLYIGSDTGAPNVHVWRNSSGYWTRMHWDGTAILCVVLRGCKTFFLGPEAIPEDNRKLRVTDRLGRGWTPELESRFFVPNCEVEEKDLGLFYLDSGFKKVSLTRGDAVFLPKRFLHAVFTEQDCLMLSIGVKMKGSTVERT